MIVADQANVFPPKWRNMCHGRFWDVFASLAQRRDGFGEIDGVPGGHGSHEQVETTGPMDLIFQSAIAQFPQATEEELACKASPLLSPIRMRRRSVASRKYSSKKEVRSSLPNSVSALAT